MNFSNIVKSALTLFVIVAIFGAAAFGLNFYTAPIIEQNNAGAANDRLNSVISASQLKELAGARVCVLARGGGKRGGK